jgi:hypothetical protein
MTITKTFTILFFIAITAISVKAQTTWVKQQLDGRVAVKFPAAPKMSARGPIVMYRDTDKNNLIYAAAVVDYMVIAQLDSAKLAVMKDTQQFADGIKNGMATTAKSYEFGDVTLGKWKGYSTYSIAGTSATNKAKMYFMIILIGSKGYNLSCVVPDGVSPQSKDDFFGMAELNR